VAGVCALGAGPGSMRAQVPAPPAALAAGPAPAPQPLSLAQAHAIAVHHHPEIAAAGYRAQAEHEVFVQSRAGLLPQVNLYGAQVHAGSANTRLMAGGLNNPTVFSRSAARSRCSSTSLSDR